MMYPHKFVEPLAPTGAQLKSYMETVICFLSRNSAEISVFVVINWFLYREIRSLMTYKEHIVQLFILSNCGTRLVKLSYLKTSTTVPSTYTNVYVNDGRSFHRKQKKNAGHHATVHTHRNTLHKFLLTSTLVIRLIKSLRVQLTNSAYLVLLNVVEHNCTQSNLFSENDLFILFSY